jgi:hypothetical protein
VPGRLHPRATPAAQARAHRLLFVSGGPVGPVGPGKCVGLGRPIARSSQKGRRRRRAQAVEEEWRTGGSRLPE